MTNAGLLAIRDRRAFLLRLVALIAAANLFALGLAGLALYQSHQRYGHTAAVNSQNLAHILERNIAATVDQIDSALLSVIDELDRQVRTKAIDDDALHTLLKHQLSRIPGIQGLRVADAGGRLRQAVGVVSSADRQITISDRDYFQFLRDHPDSGLVISQPLFGRISQKWLVVLARRLNTADGTFAGVVFAPVTLEQFSQTFAGLDLGPKGAVSLRDPSLAVIARYPETVNGNVAATGQKAVSQQLVDNVAHSPQAGTYVAHAGIDQIERTLSYRKVGNRPLYVIVGLATDDTMKDWWRELYRNLVLFALFIPLTLAGGIWIYRGWRQKGQALEQAGVASARLRAILDNTPIGLMILDSQLRIREANAVLAQIFGLDAADLANTPTQILYASREEFENLSGRAYPEINAGRTFSDTVLMRRRDGGVFWCKLIGRQVSPDNPELGYVWTLEDVTEQRTAEAALRASEERFRLLVDGVRDYAIIMLDPQGNVVTWNNGAQAIKGYAAEEIIGRSFTLFYPPEDVAAGIPQHALDQAARNGRFEGEGWRVRKNGSRFWGSILITALHDDHGRIRGFSKITRDITERQRAEVEIRRLISYQQAILANSPVGIAILDLERNILQANGAFCAIYGREGEDLRGRPASILYADPEQYADVGRRAYPLVRQGGTFSDDVRMQRRDGTRLWVKLVAHLVDERQPELGVVWAAEDISALKSLNDSLMRSNADLERFAYVASHDLRQPLRMISSYIGLIERRLKDTMDDEMREFMGFAINGAKRMDRMIIDLLDYSRIARRAEAFQPVPLADAIAKACENLNEAITESGARISVPSDLPTVPGSASELERLFQNLIANAIKFRAEDRAPEIRITCAAEDSEWIVSISDNGIGIDPADHNRLFNIFSRLVSQDQYEGSGIGLASCRKIAEHHGGRIWLESQLGHGCTFHVALSMRATADHPAAS